MELEYSNYLRALDTMLQKLTSIKLQPVKCLVKLKKHHRKKLLDFIHAHLMAVLKLWRIIYASIIVRHIIYTLVVEYYLIMNHLGEEKNLLQERLQKALQNIRRQAKNYVSVTSMLQEIGCTPRMQCLEHGLCCNRNNLVIMSSLVEKLILLNNGLKKHAKSLE